MSRFNSNAYDKLFPRASEPAPAPESAVDTFHPTKDKLEGKDPDVHDPEPAEIPEEIPGMEEGVENGNGGSDEPDPE